MLRLAKFITIAGITMGTSMAHASMALAVPKDSSGKVGQTIAISSMYQYKIENNTSSYQNYNGFEELEVNGKKERRPLNFSLPPNGIKRANDDMISFGYIPDQPGDFTIRSEIKIIGMNGAAHRASSTLKVKE